MLVSEFSWKSLGFSINYDFFSSFFRTRNESWTGLSSRSTWCFNERWELVRYLYIASEPPDTLASIALIRRKQSRNGLFLLALIFSLQLCGGYIMERSWRKKKNAETVTVFKANHATLFKFQFTFRQRSGHHFQQMQNGYFQCSNSSS